METLEKLIQEPEGRKLEFKEKLPSASELAKTIISFANDSGGELYIGIQDDPREIVGLNQGEVLKIEEKISNIIHDKVSPMILPEISFRFFENEQYMLKGLDSLPL